MNQTNAKLLEATRNILDNFRALKNDKLKIDICQYLLEGNMYIIPKRIPNGFTYEEGLRFTVEDFDWDLEYPQFTSSCQLHLQALDPVKFLVQGFEVASEESYLDLAGGLIDSWLDYESTVPDNRFVWYDHCAAERALIMLYFVLSVKNNDFTGFSSITRRINASLKDHAQFFMDDGNYKPGNHGTMVDRSLYLISKYLDNSDSGLYRDKAIERMQTALKRDFSKNMVTVENSIQYHLFDSDMYHTIENHLLNPFGDSLGAGLGQHSLESGTDFLIYASKPDLTFPTIGDGSNPSLAEVGKYSFYSMVEDYPPLRYILSKGAEGEVPESLFKVYDEEGYAFFHTDWDPQRADEAVYASFRAGFKVKYHKHADDLSLTLYAHGKNVFVDSGTYTHEYGDYRRFFMSALAHSTVIVDDQSYPFLWGDAEDTGIIDHGSGENYSYVAGKNDMYKGINITRSLYFLRNGVIVIIDDLKSQNTHKYSQYYQLSSDIKIKDMDVKLEDGNTVLDIEDPELAVRMFQLGSCEVDLVKGDKDVPGPGIVSLDFGHLEESAALKFSKSSSDARFVTLISVGDPGEYDGLKCSIEDDELIVGGASIPEVRIPLPEYSRKMAQYLKVEKVSDNEYDFTITDTEVGEEFAWYIFKDGERVDVVWYSDKPSLNYRFSEPGEYQVKYFIKKGEDKKMHTSPRMIKITREMVKTDEQNIMEELKSKYESEQEHMEHDYQEKIDEINVQLLYYQRTAECLQKKLNNTFNLEDTSQIEDQIIAIANTKPYRMAYFLRRFSHEFLKGNKKEKKNFLKWAANKVLRRKSGSPHKYNPLYEIIKK